MKPIVSLIAAVSSNYVIGKNNTLLWRIPEDMKRFKELTLNHPIIMGRKTYESIGHSLPGRTNIVVTNNTEYILENCTVVHSLDEALSTAAMHDAKEVFVIGGGQLYKEAILRADRLYITEVHREYEGDAFFPDYSAFPKVISREDKMVGDLSYSFLVLER